jgi:hypothetical protein
MMPRWLGEDLQAEAAGELGCARRDAAPVQCFALHHSIHHHQQVSTAVPVGLVCACLVLTGNCCTGLREP